jgi:hypothetical protein
MSSALINRHLLEPSITYHPRKAKAVISGPHGNVVLWITRLQAESLARVLGLRFRDA